MSVETEYGVCENCQARTLHPSIDQCRDCLRQTPEYFDWKRKNDYLSLEEKQELARKIKEAAEK